MSLDGSEIVRWQNAAAVALFGDKRGTPSAPPVDESSRGDLATRQTYVVPSAAGEPTRVEAVAIPLSDDSGPVGMLKIAQRVSSAPPAGKAARLTPREQQTLRLLAAGMSTQEIADELGVARETARNYIRRLLRVLGVHSRVAAVAQGRDSGLV